MNLNKSLKKWNLEAPLLLTKTPTSHIYKVRLDDKVFVLKLLTQVGMQDETKGATALKYFDGKGAVKLIAYDSSAHLLEYAEGSDLRQLVCNGQDVKATEIIAQTVLALHKNRRKELPKNLTSLKERYRSLINRTNSNNQILDKGKTLAENLLDSEVDKVVLHGDIHHENILLTANRGWVAIDPKGLIGDSAYELANSLINPMDKTNLVQSKHTFFQRVDTLAKLTGHSKRRIVAFSFTHACLSACWSLESGKDPKHALTMARVIEPLLDTI